MRKCGDFSSFDNVCRQYPQPDPDIAGVGVIAAFLVSAWGPLMLSTICYASGHVPDELLTNFDLRIMHVRPESCPSRTNAFQKAVKAFGDQQIVTGVAILAAGFAKFYDISVYHWHELVYLAWMSSAAHLTSLTFLRGYFRQNTALRMWRLAGMLVLFAMLMVGLVPFLNSSTQYALLGSSALVAGTGRFREGPCWTLQLPIHCFWGSSTAASIVNFGPLFGFSQDSILFYTFQLLLFSWKVLLAFERTGEFMIHYCREIPLMYLERKLQRLAKRCPGQRERHRVRTLPVLCGYIAAVALYLPLLALIEFFSSFAGSLFLIAVSMAWGTAQILSTRSRLPDHVLQQENSWGFGQILPMMFLALPVLGMTESVSSKIQHHIQTSRNVHETDPSQ